MKSLFVLPLFLLFCGPSFADETEDILDATASTFDQVNATYQESGMNGLQKDVQDCYRQKAGFVCLVVDGMSFWIDQAMTGQLKMPVTPFFQRTRVVQRYVKSGQVKNAKEGETMLAGIMNMTSRAYDRTELHKNAQSGDDGQE